ncbi:MAG: hypothetical protein II845_04280 [Oscillospiraceae bacterium]|nr:hypothetical protein [Oscillospiraceae bacterium]
MLLATIKVNCSSHRVVNKWWSIIMVAIIMTTVVTLGVKKEIAVGNYMLYNWICLPCFMFILFGLAGIDSNFLNRSKALKWMSSISYAFFLAQLFSNNVSKELIKHFSIESNTLKIIIGWTSCLIITLVIRLIELRINKYIKKHV